MEDIFEFETKIIGDTTCYKATGCADGIESLSCSNWDDMEELGHYTYHGIECWKCRSKTPTSSCPDGWFEQYPGKDYFKLFDISRDTYNGKTCYKVNGCNTETNSYIHEGTGYEITRTLDGKTCGFNWPTSINLEMGISSTNGYHQITPKGITYGFGSSHSSGDAYSTNDFALVRIQSYSEKQEEDRGIEFRAGCNGGTPSNTFLELNEGEFTFKDRFSGAGDDPLGQCISIYSGYLMDDANYVDDYLNHNPFGGSYAIVGIKFSCTMSLADTSFSKTFDDRKCDLRIRYSYDN